MRAQRRTLTRVFGIGTLSALVIASSACSMKSSDSYVVRIPIPGSRSTYHDPLAHLFKMAYATSTTPLNLGETPTTMDDFDCFGVNITGPGIPIDPRRQCTNPDDVQGIIGGFVPAQDGYIDVEVPGGADRHVQVYGMKSLIGCPNLSDLLNQGDIDLRFKSNFGKPYLVGDGHFDVFGDTTATLHVKYDSTSPKALFTSCQGGAGGGGASHLWSVFNNGMQGTVNSTLLMGTTLYLGGAFDYVGPATEHGVLIDPLSLASPILNQPDAFINNTVQCAAPDGTGGFFVAGMVMGDNHQLLTHILRDGHKDPGFIYDVTGNVLACAFDPNTMNLFIGGNFTQVGGNSSFARLAVINVAQQTVQSMSPISGAGATVYAMHLDGSSLYVGGSFTSPTSYLAAFDASTRGLISGFSPGLTGEVRAIASTASSVYAVGGFTARAAKLSKTDGSSQAFSVSLPPGTPYAVITDSSSDLANVYIGGDDTGTPAGYVKQFAYNGTPGWMKVTSGTGGDNVRTLAYLGSKLFVGGHFSQLDTQKQMNLVALDPSNGTPLAGFVMHSSNAVNVVAVDLGTARLFIGGEFESIGGQAAKNLAALDVLTGKATGWKPGTDGPVLALATDKSKIYVGGSFSDLNSSTHQNVGAVNLSSGAEEPWPDDVAGGPVNALAFRDGLLYVGGSFLSAGTIGTEPSPRVGAAAFDSTGHLQNWDAGLDCTDCVVAVNAIQVGAPANVSSPGNVYLAGIFDLVHGQSLLSLGAVTGGNSGGSLVGGFKADIRLSSSKGQLYAMTFYGSKLVVGGTFDQIADNSGIHGLRKLAMVSSIDGSSDPWDPSSDPSLDRIASIRALAVSGDRLYVGGMSNYPLNGASSGAAFDFAAGGTMTSWNPGIGLDTGSDTIYSLTATPSFVFIGGDFHQADGPSMGNSKFSPGIGVFDAIYGHLR